MSEVNGNPAAAAGAAPGGETNPTDQRQTTGAQGATAANGGAAQSAASAVKEAAAEAARRLKIKNDDGTEEEVDETEVVKVYRERKGHQRAANQSLQEGKAAKKQAIEFLGMMKDKGKAFEVLQKLGHDPRKLAEEYLAAQLEDELLDPREKELREAKAKLQKYADLEKTEKEETERRRDAELKKKFADDYAKQFTEALKESQLPATKETIGEMAKYISRSAKIGFQMTAKEAAQLVREDIEKRQQALYGNADADTLVRLLGDQGLQKIRTYDTSRLKDPAANLKTPTEQPEPRERVRNTGKRMSNAEWRKFNRAG